MIKTVKVVAMVLTAITVVWSEVPLVINFPGKLSEKNGNPITGSKNIKFSFFDAETGGSEKWTGSYSISVTKGVFSVLLGSGASTFPVSLDFSQNYWLEMTVEGEVLTPRQRVSSTAYSIRSEFTNRAEVVNTPIVYTGSADIDANNSEKVYIHLDKVPRSVKLYLYGEKMSTLYYTELGAHSHTASSGSAGDHGHNMLVEHTSSWFTTPCIRDGEDTGGTRSWRSWPIMNSGSHSHAVSVDNNGNASVPAGTTNKTFPNAIRILVDGNNKTGFIGNPNSRSYWNAANNTWGDGSHEFTTGELNITPYFTSTGEHKIEFTESAGGKIRYNIYVYY